MLLLSSKIPNHSSVKNIIFDFGGVICDLEIQRSVEKFKAFGKPKNENNESREEQDRNFEHLVSIYETGLITTQEFRNEIRNHYQVPPSDQAIDDAWNALLVGIPEPRIQLLEEIRNNYRLFLLSNSNEIHYLKYSNDLRQKFGYPDFNALFENTYFSWRLHLRKPDPAIFRWVLDKNNLVPSQTAFIDDTLIHVKVALELGINAYQLKEAEDITGLFST
jgi:epoxide hydrolase-like predicted phosphatase